MYHEHGQRCRGCRLHPAERPQAWDQVVGDQRRLEGVRLQGVLQRDCRIQGRWDTCGEIDVHCGSCAIAYEQCIRMESS